MDMARLVETQRLESLRAAEARASSFLSSFSKGELSANQRPVFKSRDPCQPISCKYSGHVTCFGHLEASVMVT